MREVLDGQAVRRNVSSPLMLRGVDGVERMTYWDSESVPVRGPGGEIEGVLVCALDVTDRVERERLQQERSAALEAATQVDA